MAKKEAKKEKAFGDFKSAEEINACAAGLKAEGDTDSVKALAEENGIDREMVKMFLSGEIPELCDDMTAAMGRLNTELKEITGREKPLVETVIKPHLDSLATDPEICAAILGGKSMKTVAADVWSRAEKKKVNSGAYIPDEEIRDIVEEYYRK